MHKKLLLLLALFLLLSACTPVPDAPTPAPTSENTPTSTLAPTPTPENTPTDPPEEMPQPYWDVEIIDIPIELSYDFPNSLTLEYSLIFEQPNKYSLLSITNGENEISSFTYPDKLTGDDGRSVSHLSPDNSIIAVFYYNFRLDGDVRYIDRPYKLAVYSCSGELLQMLDLSEDTSWMGNPTSWIGNKKIVLVDGTSWMQQKGIYIFDVDSGELEYYPVEYPGLHMQGSANFVADIFLNKPMTHLFYFAPLRGWVFKDLETGDDLWAKNVDQPTWNEEGTEFTFTAYTDDEGVIVDPNIQDSFRQELFSVNLKGEETQLTWFNLAFPDVYSKIRGYDISPSKRYISISLEQSGLEEGNILSVEGYILDTKNHELLHLPIVVRPMYGLRLDWSPDEEFLLVEYVDQGIYYHHRFLLDFSNKILYELTIKSGFFDWVKIDNTLP